MRNNSLKQIKNKKEITTIPANMSRETAFTYLDNLIKTKYGDVLTFSEHKEYLTKVFKKLLKSDYNFSERKSNVTS